MTRSILVVDDDEGIRTSVCDALSDPRTDVRVASDGGGALSALAEAPSDLVVTDVRMPGMDGLELLQLLKKRQPDTDVILITAYDDVGGKLVRERATHPASLAFGFLMICLLAAVRPAVLGAQAERVPLFNERDLSGWNIHGTERWYVEAGELVCESGPDEAYGYLATEATYRDFDLTLEFKQEADGNSGVFIRSHLEGTRISGWQAEVAPPGQHTGGIYESYGRGWLIRPDPELDSVLRMGEWNEMRVRVAGDRVTTWLNGIQMIDLRDERIGEATGSIALQIHGGGGIKVRWRNLYLEKL